MKFSFVQIGDLELYNKTFTNFYNSKVNAIGAKYIRVCSSVKNKK